MSTTSARIVTPIAAANAHRMAKITALVAAHKGGDFEAVETAMMAVRLPRDCNDPTKVGFAVPDLRYWYNSLAERAEYLEDVHGRKAGSWGWLSAQYEKAQEAAERKMEKARRIGGTIPNKDFIPLRDEAHAARDTAAEWAAKRDEVGASLADLERSVVALDLARASIKALIETRTTCVLQSQRTSAAAVQALVG
jgi:hypothetical protein